jgi:hypothetical protein
MSVFLTVFSILFYIDNKHRFTDTKMHKNNRIEVSKLKWVLVKLGSTLSVAEIEYSFELTVTKFSIQV